MEIAVKAKAEVVIPDVPDNIELDGGQEVRIQDLKVSDLRNIGREWTANLVARAQELREADELEPEGGEGEAPAE